MPQTRLIEAEEADQMARNAAQGLLDFLATFNTSYPDLDAPGVASEFEYFNKRYVVQTCASILSKHFIVTLQPARFEVESIGRQDFGLPMAKPRAALVVDIGASTTDIAVIGPSGIVYSRSIRTAGNEMDEVIISYIKRKYNVLIGERTAEAIKIEMGSAFPLQQPLSYEVRGRNLIENIPKTISISDEEIRKALADSVSTIVTAVRVALERTPPELLGDLVKRGILLTGGGSLLKNLSMRLRTETGLTVSAADDPLASLVLGADDWKELIKERMKLIKNKRNRLIKTQAKKDPGLRLILVQDDIRSVRIRTDELADT